MWRSIDTRTLAKERLLVRVDNPTDLPVVAVRDYNGRQAQPESIEYFKGFIQLTFAAEFEGEVALASPA